jgi:hypothetical protein
MKYFKASCMHVSSNRKPVTKSANTLDPDISTARIDLSACFERKLQSNFKHIGFDFGLVCIALEIMP